MGLPVCLGNHRHVRCHVGKKFQETWDLSKSWEEVNYLSHGFLFFMVLDSTLIILPAKMMLHSSHRRNQELPRGRAEPEKSGVGVHFPKRNELFKLLCLINRIIKNCSGFCFFWGGGIAPQPLVATYDTSHIHILQNLIPITHLIISCKYPRWTRWCSSNSKMRC